MKHEDFIRFEAEAVQSMTSHESKTKIATSKIVEYTIITIIAKTFSEKAFGSPKLN